MRSRLRLLSIAAAMAAATAFAVSAQAEVAQRGGVRVAVSGSLRPAKLPRSGSAPVAVSLTGGIVAARQGSLPQLTGIEVALNSHGELKTGAVPVCRLGKIDPSTTEEALLACRRSLIGEGSFSADVRIPDQSPFPSHGKLLAFNGKLRGRPAIFAHIYGTDPVPTSYVLPFAIRKISKGTYGTMLSASLPQVTGDWGYVTGISLQLQSRYAAAACPAPAGFAAAVFPLMRTSFTFDGGPQLTLTLTRSCKVGG
jgi:hypothetical protein